MPIEYVFSFICSEQCIKIVAQKVWLVLFCFKNIIPYNTIPNFQEVGGVS